MAEPLDLSKDLKLPIEVAGQVIAIVGIRNSGKTNTAGVLCEELLDRQHQVVVIDPTDAWWGLRSGYPVFIFGGPHGDIPLAETDGKGIAEFIVGERVPLILSLRHLRKNAQRRFVAELCEELYHLKGRDEYRSALTVIIDEAPLFVPQRVLGEAARVVGAVEDLCARGRNTGFGVGLITQRPATLNKDVMSLADTIIAHRLVSPHDRKALGEWLEENASAEDLKAILTSFAGMPDGRAWVWAPRLDIMRQVHIRKRRTFDSSATPKLGEVIRPPRSLHEIDLGVLTAKLTANVERQKAEDPKALRAELAAVRAELAKLKASPATKATRVEVPVLKPADAKRLEYLTGRMEAILKQFDGWRAAFEARGQEIRAAAAEIAATARAGLTPRVPARHIASAPPAPPRPTSYRLPAASPANALPQGERIVLTAIAQHRDGCSREQLTVLTGYKRSSRDTYLQRLRERGAIDVAGDRITATAEGVARLGPDFAPLPTGAALRAHWLARLPEGERVVLEVLIEAHPKAMEREAISNVTAYKRSSRDTYLQRLRARRLVEDTGRGEVRASAELFD